MLRYLALGLLQGLTEFLPVSSSGHLVLAKALLGLHPPGVALEGALHLGTLVAVLVYFRGDIRALIRGCLQGKRDSWVYIGFLGLATVPAVAVGLLLRERIEGAFSSVPTVGSALLLTAVLLLAADRLSWRAVRREVGVGSAVAVGLAQAASLVPGISRSGSTISAAILSGTRPATAARFSFLLSIPVILGAGGLSLWQGANQGIPRDEALGLLVGGVVAALSGLLAIRVLLVLLDRRRLSWFALYCFLLGGTALGWGLLRA